MVMRIVTIPRSWKPEVFVDRQWTPNNLIFATEIEAKTYAEDLFFRWTQCENFRAVPCDEAATHAYWFGNLGTLPASIAPALSSPETA